LSRAGTGADGRKMWRCNHCGLVSAWTETWVWFGSILEAEENEAGLLTFCSLDHMHAAGVHGPCLDDVKEHKRVPKRGKRKPVPGTFIDGDGI